MMIPVEQAATTLSKQASTIMLTASQFIPGSAFGLYKVSSGHIASITMSQSIDVFFYGALGGIASLMVKATYDLSISYLKQRSER